jgi:mono/diheme cytochrome c family protein
MIEYGKEVFKSKAICQFCHKWDASGDQGYGGNALSLRVTQLTREQVAETIKCGRPATNMPYHDRFAYTDKRCYGMDRAMAGKDMPPGANNEYLSPRDIDAVVRYLFAKVVGKGPSTYDDCIDFWGKDTRQCDAMKK